MIIDVNEIGTMPFNFDFNQLNDGSGVQQTLAKKHARYHRPCKLKLYTHLDREKKHTETKTDNDNCLSPVKTRQKLGAKPSEKDICFFCEEVVDKKGLHSASTDNFDAKIREIATELNETKLIAKLINKQSEM